MELKHDPAPAGWSEPRAAYDSYRPGLSPYLHYLQAGRVEGSPDHDPDAGADLPGEVEQALRDLILQSFG